MTPPVAPHIETVVRPDGKLAWTVHHDLPVATHLELWRALAHTNDLKAAYA